MPGHVKVFAIIIIGKSQVLLKKINRLIMVDVVSRDLCTS